MTTYTMKSLEWRESDPGFWQADSIFGDFAVGELGKQVRVWVDAKDVRSLRSDSIDDGKAKAEAYYRERLLPALVPVPDGAQVVGVAYNPNPERRT